MIRRIHRGCQGVGLEARVDWAYMEPMLRTLFLFLFLLPAFTVSASAPPNVLVLHSYHPGLSWTDNLNDGIIRTFQEEMPEALLQVEYLDTKRNTGDSYLFLQAALLRHKLSGTVFGLVIVTDNDALDFVLRYRESIFHSAPVVFCGVNHFQDGQLGGQSGITGLSENPAFVETMYTALRLHPDTREFIVIGGDRSVTDLLTDRAIRRLEKDFPGILFTYWNDLSARELRSRLDTLRPGQVVFVHGVMRNEEGVLVDYRGKNRFLAALTSVPIYGFWDFEMGTGCVGGKMIQGRDEGRRVALLAMRVLRGEAPDAIAVDQNTPSRYIFDFQQLERFGIDMGRLPENSLILNQAAKVYHIDKRYIWTALAAVLLLLTVMAMLTSSNRRRREAQDVLRRHKEQLEDAVRARTEHLRAANDELEREVHERIRAEGDLRKVRARLEIEVDRRTMDLRFEIAQRRQAEAHIRDREAKARALINAPTETLLLMDRHGVILDINETGAARLGKNQESLIGQNLYALVDGDLAKALRRSAKQVFSAGEAQSVEEHGQARDLDLHIYPVFGDTKRVTRVAVFMADVTESRRMARQIVLLDKINSLGRMAAGIAHEIRNPLTGIHGYLYAMEELCSGTPGVESGGVLRATIGKIRKAAEKMEAVIRRVLDFSKPGVPRLECLDLTLPVQEALSLMASTLRKAGIAVETSFSAVSPIQGDRMQLEQAVINILDNASRALRQCSGEKRLSIVVSETSDRVRLSVADNGPGITPQDRERIFDPFYTTAADGTGIGLSIVQRIVADHRGVIQVRESLSGGAEFILEFPVSAGEHT